MRSKFVSSIKICFRDFQNFERNGQLSDGVDWVVVLDVSLGEADALAVKVWDWLIAQEIILPRLAAERSLKDGELWQRGWADRWDDDLTFHPRPSLSGLEIVKGRRVFDAGGNGLDALVCPQCEERHDPDTLEWSDAIGAWYLGNDASPLRCAGCLTAHPIVEWAFDVPWALGNLGFGFWNWVIKPEVVDRISSLTGHRCRLVRQRI